MPCNGENYFIKTRTAFVDNPKHKQLIDILTRRLCHACSLLEENSIEMPAELYEWHYEHKLEDQARIKEAKRRREEREAQERRDEYLQSVKERIMKQMTDDEKEALGFLPNIGDI